MTNTTSPAKLQHREKALEALRLRRDTEATWLEISQQLGYHSEQTAQRAVARLANRIESKEVESYRDMFDGQLAFLWDQCQDRILTSDRNAMGFATLLQSGVRIIDRRAKLHGVDAAVKVEVTEVTRSAIDQEIEVLAQAIKDRAAGGPAEPAGVDLTKHQAVDA